MDDAVLPVALSDARPSSTHGSAPIPQVLSTFLGRVRETRAGLRLLAASEMRLLTILGPAGVGKTRFAQHLITRYLATFPERERIVWVDLTSATSDDLVAAIATAVGAGEGGCASTFDGICVAPSARPVILVLDTMEHLSGSGKLIADLLAATPTLRCLVTSQTPLHLRGEQLFRLPPLSLPERDAVRGHRIGKSDAVQLFMTRAAAVDPEISLTTENEEVIAELCRRLDGLPLAIELAAARIELLPPKDLLARLDHRLPLLIGGAEDAPARHRTLETAIGWSYDLLAPPQQRFVRWLSVFLDGFTLAAAEQMGAAAGLDRVLQRVSDLLDASLLQPRQANGSSRLGMLESIREFGLARLLESGELEEAQAAQADIMRCFILDAEPHLFPAPDLPYWLQLVENELENMHLALRWYEAHDVVTCGRLANALGQFWHRLSMLREARDWSERILAHPALPREARARAQIDLVRIMNYQLDFSAPHLLDEALAGATASGDVVAQVDALTVQMMRAILGREPACGIGCMERAQAIVEQIPGAGRAPRAATLDALSVILQAMTLEPAAGLALLNAKLGEYQHVEDTMRCAMLLFARGFVEREVGDTAAAIRSLQSAIAGYATVRERWSIAAATAALADLLAGSDPETSARLAGFGYRLMMLMGLGPATARVLEFERARSDATESAADAQWTRWYAAGEQLPFEDGIALVLRIGQTESAGDLPGPGVPLPVMEAPTRKLTPREREVLMLIAAGRSDREIAHQLGISYRTTTTFVTAILRKLDVPSRAAAAAWAVRLGMTDSPHVST